MIKLEIEIKEKENSINIKDINFNQIDIEINEKGIKPTKDELKVAEEINKRINISKKVQFLNKSSKTHEYINEIFEEFIKEVMK